jgi:hypothetical protein
VRESGEHIAVRAEKAFGVQPGDDLGSGGGKDFGVAEGVGGDAGFGRAGDGAIEQGSDAGEGALGRGRAGIVVHLAQHGREAGEGFAAGGEGFQAAPGRAVGAVRGDLRGDGLRRDAGEQKAGERDLGRDATGQAENDGVGHGGRRRRPVFMRSTPPQTYL